jgi:DNA gyrase subunit B
VGDNGRGVPVEIHAETGLSALEMSFTKLHTGGKFDQDSYTTSGGLHGVGIKATNALSSWLEVVVLRHGVRYRQRYEHGVVQTPVEVLAPHDDEVIGVVGQRGEDAAVKRNRDNKLPTGTIVSFLPSNTYLEVTRFDHAAIAHRLEVAAYLIPGLTLTLTDRRHGEPVFREYSQMGGIEAYVRHLNAGRKVVHKQPIRVAGRTESGAKVDLVLQYHGDDDEEILSFVNTIPTSDGGTHVSGFRAALTKAINVFGQEKKQISGAEGVTGRDSVAGLTVVISVLMGEPEFTSQTKSQLGNRDMHGQVMSLVYEGFLEQLRKDPGLGRKIVDRCMAAARAREAAAKARSLVMRKSVLDVVDSGLPGKLADVAKNADTSRTVLYIVEGDSAGGSCKQARSSRFHAILPVRGKILNTERARLNRVLGNNEVKALVSAIGAGVGRDFRAEDMRYAGVAIFVDADVDGLHIMTLLLTMFWRLMRPMIDEGRLYIARAPMYLLRKSRAYRYAYSEWERDQVLKDWGRKGVHITLYKGLGEMTPRQLKETVFDVPEVAGEETPFANPNLFRVTVEDAHRANRMVELWMGSNVAPRKARLMRVWDDAGDYDATADGFGEAGDDLGAADASEAGDTVAVVGRAIGSGGAGIAEGAVAADGVVAADGAMTADGAVAVDGAAETGSAGPDEEPADD